MRWFLTRRKGLVYRVDLVAPLQVVAGADGLVVAVEQVEGAHSGSTIVL